MNKYLLLLLLLSEHSKFILYMFSYINIENVYVYLTYESYGGQVGYYIFCNILCIHMSPICHVLHIFDYPNKCWEFYQVFKFEGSIWGSCAGLGEGRREMLVPIFLPAWKPAWGAHSF